MKTKTVQLYEYEDIMADDDLREKVLDQNRYINVDDSFWHEYLTEDFYPEKLNALGFEYAKILFSGFSSQGDGACFDSGVNMVTILENLLSCAPDYKSAQFFRRALILAENDFLSGEVVDVGGLSNFYSHERTRRFVISEQGLSNHGFWVEFCNKLEEIIEEYRFDIAHEIYLSLQSEYDYMTSDEVISETIEANGYTFNENGEID